MLLALSSLFSGSTFPENVRVTSTLYKVLESPQSVRELRALILHLIAQACACAGSWLDFHILLKDISETRPQPRCMTHMFMHESSCMNTITSHTSCHSSRQHNRVTILHACVKRTFPTFTCIMCRSKRVRERCNFYSKCLVCWPFFQFESMSRPATLQGEIYTHPYVLKISCVGQAKSNLRDCPVPHRPFSLVV